jgi:hypothetical protein
MKTIWTGRVAQAAGKYGEHAPMATVCCNACRTCVTTNIVGVALAGIAGAAYAVSSFARRRFLPKPPLRGRKPDEAPAAAARRLRQRAGRWRR